MDLAVTQSHHTIADATRLDGSCRNYDIFGMSVESDFRLPIPESSMRRMAPPDVRVRHAGHQMDAPPPEGPKTHELCCSCERHLGQAVMTTHHGPSGTWIRYEDLVTFHIAANGAVIDIFADLIQPEIEDAVGLVMTGVATAIVIHQLRHILCLHASGVVTPAGAIAFIGPKGQGKSTIAAGFLARGATLLTDDLLPLQCASGQYLAIPGPPIMKLWSQSMLHALESDADHRPLAPGVDKHLVKMNGGHPVAQTPAPLRRIYVIQRYESQNSATSDILIRTPSRKTALLALAAQVSVQKYLTPQEFGTLLPALHALIDTVPVRTLLYPTGFEHQDAVFQHILLDLGGEQ
jgi:hypothetical protein